MDISAKWIWSDTLTEDKYNLCSVFKKDFRLEELPNIADLILFVDSYYRLKVNGQWICDGPARSYPEHALYDKLDLSGCLRVGLNIIEITVRYYGCGTFHQIPQHPVMLCQLDLINKDNTSRRIESNEDFLSAKVSQFIENSAEISRQLPAMEIFDNRNNILEWNKSIVVFDQQTSPWKNLSERDCKLLTKREAIFKSFVGGKRVKSPDITISIPAKRLYFPNSTNNNISSFYPYIVVFELVTDIQREILIESSFFSFVINGESVEDEKFILKSGSNLLVCIPSLNGVCFNERAISFSEVDGVEILNPFDKSKNISILKFDELAVEQKDYPKYVWTNELHSQLVEKFTGICNEAKKIRNINKFIEKFEKFATILDNKQLTIDPYWQFFYRKAYDIENNDIIDGENAIYQDQYYTTINPNENFDIELCYDLGEQNIGFWNFGIFASAGTIIDINAIEYISPENGNLQHTNYNRNSMRYICSDGYNRYTSIKRRSGRYVFLTVRNAKTAVKLQFFRLVESTYPVVNHSSFNCSDFVLNKIYDMSIRTLKLCMEDTFTDCPLYEQTLWVGDARNEGLFAMSSFKSYDIIKRCIKLASQSLERMPLVGSQVPSCWENVIPAWSFLWGISIDDYYKESGDLDFITEMWPMVKQNIEESINNIDEEVGLFKSYNWNLFDWSKTNCNKPFLLYNSMFMVGALDAAINNAKAIGNLDDKIDEYLKVRASLCEAINSNWNRLKLAWPDSIDEDFKISDDISMHTSMLALLYNIADEEQAKAAKVNIISPRPILFSISSPFASFYLYEAFEKIDMHTKIIKSIRDDYMPMVESNSSTVWESFPNSIISQNEFPTRSHCHGWSASPVYFFPRIILGIFLAEIGGKKFEISPYVNDLSYATGSRPTVNGNIEVQWVIRDKNLFIKCTASKSVELVYKSNNTHIPYNVYFNGVLQQK